MRMRFAMPCLGLLAVCCSIGRADHEAEARFLSEAPEAWRRSRASEQHIVGVLHDEAWAFEQGERNTHWGRDRTTRFRRNGPHIALTVTMPESEEERVFVIGPSYSFHLSRATHTSPYVLKGLVLGPPETAGGEVRSATYVYRAIQAGRELWNVPLEELIADPGFTLRGVEEMSEGEKPMFQVDFDCVSKKHDQTWRNARITLSPTEGWCIRRAEFNPRGDWRRTIEIDHRTMPDGAVAVLQYRKTDHFPDHQIDEYARFTLEELGPAVVPESQFTLTAFGLPEPGVPLSPSGGGSLHYWLFGGGLALFGAAIALRRAARRAA